MKLLPLKWLFFFLLFIINIALSSCMLGSAAVTGAQAVYNRHNIEKKLDDNYTTMQAYRAIYLDTHMYKNTNISIATFNDSILITGQVPNPKHKKEIKALVKNISGKRTVYDFTETVNPSSTLTRASDSWITSKIKAQLIALNEVDPSQIKVVTENGTVFLMGIISHEQAEIAVDIAKDTSGVQNVVKIFSYLTVNKA